MSVASRIIAGPHQITAGTTYIIGPAVGQVWVLRTQILVNDRAAAVPFTVGIGSLAEASLLMKGLTVPANGRRTIEERWYLQAGLGGLWIQNNHATHPITYTLMGAVLLDL